MIWVVKAELRDEYKIFIEFNDGVNGVIDFKEKLEKDHRPIINELLDKSKFNTVRVDFDTICWENGVDFAPEYLYEKIINENKKVA